MRRVAQRQVFHYPYLNNINPVYNAIFYDDDKFLLRTVWSEPVRINKPGQPYIVRKDDIAFQTKFNINYNGGHVFQSHYYSLSAEAEEPRAKAGNLAHMLYSSPVVQNLLRDGEMKTIIVEDRFTAASNTPCMLLADEGVYGFATSHPNILVPAQGLFLSKIDAKTWDDMITSGGSSWKSAVDFWPISIQVGFVKGLNPN